MKYNQKPPRANNRFQDKTKKTAWKNSKIVSIIKQDFERMVDKKDNGIFLFNKLLLSPTRLTDTFSKIDMINIPENILNTRKEIGANLMTNLKTMFDNKTYNTNDLLINQRDRTYLNNLIDFFLDNKIRIMSVEKFITNGVFCGYVDVIAKWNSVVVGFEIKCRNSNIVKFQDVVQTTIYKRMLHNIDFYILLLNDNGTVTFYRAPANRTFNQYTKFEKLMKFYFEMEYIPSCKIEPIDIGVDDET